MTAEESATCVPVLTGALLTLTGGAADEISPDGVAAVCGAVEGFDDGADASKAEGVGVVSVTETEGDTSGILLVLHEQTVPTSIIMIIKSIDNLRL